MKPLHAILLGLAFGLVIGALSAIYTRKPCPQPVSAAQTEVNFNAEHERDSLDLAIAIRKHLRDSIEAIKPERRYEQSMGIVRSLGRQQQLDRARQEPD